MLGVSSLCYDVVRDLQSICFAESFVFCDLNITNTEHDVLKQLGISSWEDTSLYYGDLSEPIYGLTDFFQGQGNSKNISEDAALLINKVAKDLLPDNQSTYIWLTGQKQNISQKMKSFDINIPRWHQDPNLSQSNDIEYRISVCFKGPHTLFVKPSAEQIKEMHEGYSIKEDSEVSWLKIYKIYQHNTIFSASNYQAAIFATATHNDAAALHSLPYDFNEERLCIFMDFGSKEQIAAKQINDERNRRELADDNEK